MNTRSRRLLAIAQAIGLACTTAAHAVTFTTAPSTVPGGDWTYCEIANVSTAPVQVTASIVSLAGIEMLSATTCPPPPATIIPGSVCYAVFGTNQLGTTYCKFTSSSSKVRASLAVVDPLGAPIVTLPATK